MMGFLRTKHFGQTFKVTILYITEFCGSKLNADLLLNNVMNFYWSVWYDILSIQILCKNRSEPVFQYNVGQGNIYSPGDKY